MRQHAREHAAIALHALAQQATDYRVPARDRRAACRLLLRVGWGRESGIGRAILDDLGWEQLKTNLATEQARDERLRGDRARQILGTHGAR